MLKDIGNDIYCIIYGRFIGAIYIRCIYNIDCQIIEIFPSNEMKFLAIFYGCPHTHTRTLIRTHS